VIDRVAFGSGYALYAFDLGEKAHFSLTKQGRVRLVLKFGEGDRLCGVSKHDRDRQTSERNLRFIGMNTHE